MEEGQNQWKRCLTESEEGKGSVQIKGEWVRERVNEVQ